jgi:hypothetical protein
MIKVKINHKPINHRLVNLMPTTIRLNFRNPRHNISIAARKKINPKIIMKRSQKIIIKRS